MTDKIEKLLLSRVYGDVYIGLKLLDNMPRGKIPAFLKRIGFSKKEVHISWYLGSRSIRDIPVENINHYIEGKLYYYAVNEAEIIIDSSTEYKWTIGHFSEEDDDFKVIETWK